METKVTAQPNSQNVLVERSFDAPVHLVYRAFSEAELLAQWMQTKVVELDCTAHGAYRFETTDPMGNVHVFHGTIHEAVPDTCIVRTFEMHNTNFPVQLEFLTFLSDEPGKTRLEMLMVFKSEAARDQMLQLPFKQGVNAAHNRIQTIISELQQP